MGYVPGSLARLTNFQHQVRSPENVAFLLGRPPGPFCRAETSLVLTVPSSSWLSLLSPKPSEGDSGTRPRNTQLCRTFPRFPGRACPVPGTGYCEAPGCTSRSPSKAESYSLSQVIDWTCHMSPCSSDLQALPLGTSIFQKQEEEAGHQGQVRPWTCISRDKDLRVPSRAQSSARRRQGRGGGARARLPMCAWTRRRSLTGLGHEPAVLCPGAQLDTEPPTGTNLGGQGLPGRVRAGPRTPHSESAQEGLSSVF